MTCYFITGVSSGIGEALVEVLLNTGDDVLVRGCSRRKPAFKDPRFQFFPCDLSVVSEANHLAEVFFKGLPAKVSTFVLINNAGILGSIGPVGQFQETPYEKVLLTNVVAPAVLCDVFVKTFQQTKAEKLILNISSGAAQNNYAGWAAYCASKAALERFGGVLAEEQKQENFPVYVHSIVPGVIDTPMQEEIRSADPKDFPTLGRFLELHKNGDLRSPFIVAKEIIRVAQQPSLRSEGLVKLFK